MDNVSRAYAKLFTTPNGKIVMQDLEDTYGGYTTEDGDALKTYGNSAARDVYIRIKLLSEGKDE